MIKKGDMPQPAFGKSPRIFCLLDRVNRHSICYCLNEPRCPSCYQNPEAVCAVTISIRSAKDGLKTHYLTQQAQFSSCHIRSNSWMSCTASCSCRKSPPVLTMTDTQSQLAERCVNELCDGIGNELRTQMAIW